MSLSSINHQGLNSQVMEEAFSYDQGYTPWNLPPYQHHTPRYDAYQSNGYDDAYYGYENPPPRYPPSQNGIEETLQLLCKERKRVFGSTKTNRRLKGREDALLHEEDGESLNHEEVHHSGDLPSQPLSNPRRCIGTLFLCTNQEEREDALLHEEDVESLNYEEVHEFLEEVEEENEDQETEDVDQEVENRDKEPKGMEIVYSASSEATPPELPSKSHFKWVNLSDLNFIGPQHYGLLEIDGQLRALCGVLDTKGMDSLVFDESRFITCRKSEFKAYSGHLHKLHSNRAKIAVRIELLMMIKLRLSLLPNWHLAQRTVQLSSVGRANARDMNLGLF
ncbi:hypothetical protein PIB30_034125 [Stylosanthes scabra]|uniref:Uncharacterized protein n=1 Tax=Stylosanthes scabra TaxID=79078 RepID=A0ABU6TCF3_9FABA|nr:hypothetical protein [Stylosanthes scabra]